MWGLPLPGASTSHLILDPIIVEAKRSRAVGPVHVSTGIGAKSIDFPQNEIGIELQTLERQLDSRSSLRDETFWFDPLPRSWQGQVALDLFQDQKIKGRFFGKISDLSIRIDGRWHRDHRKFEYLDNRHTPYSPEDDEMKALFRKRDVYAGSLKADYKGLTSLIERDFHSENVFSGAFSAGFRKKARWEVSGRSSFGAFEFLPFAFFEHRHFQSFVERPGDSRTKDVNIGFMSRYRTPWSSIIQCEFFRNSLSRDPSSFFRYGGKLTFDHHWNTNQWIETYLQASVGEVRDSASDFLKKITASAGVTKGSNLFDIGGEISSSRQYPFGGVLKVRRYEIVPTPVQLFGDGALLEPAPHLKAHRGIRWSVGPWYRTHFLDVELLFFSEESRNDFLMVATSPSTARTFGVGGVWNRGIDLRSLFKHRFLTWTGNYLFQIPLNASHINWQRGKRIPGRPRHALDSTVEVFLRSYHLGCHYRFQAGEFLDLGENWATAAEHRLAPYVGYKAKNWGARLYAKNLIAIGGSQGLEFQGRAGPNILEPEWVKREWGLNMEVLL